MAANTIIATAVLVFITALPLLPPTKANGLGFTTDLIHRDWPTSPFYNPSLTPFERFSIALRRSHNRVNHFTSIPTHEESASSKLIPTDGAYVMKLTLGTPPFTIFAIVDTGSDPIWTQCAPCHNCYEEKAPLFNPQKSSTYKAFPCHSNTCQNLLKRDCMRNGTCHYSVSYGDGSYSQGNLASETVTLGSSTGRAVVIPGIIFGCGFSNGGLFNESESGIVGLGGGPTSLISQLKSSIKGKFSYCLVPLSAKNKTSSHIHFGNNAVVLGPEVVSTPIVSTSLYNYYVLTLEGLTVGQQRLEFLNFSSPSKCFAAPDSGNIIIDSGTTLTYLPSDAYSQLESLVKISTGGETVPDPLGALELCYRVSDNPSFPTITAHFKGADIKLNHINTFIQTSDDVVCLAFARGRFAIFGNVAQTNLLVGYDLVKGTVSFKPTVCG